MSGRSLARSFSFKDPPLGISI
ncbi:hypothetical protein CP03DC29_0778B, partial [Chlamydia psittaci 03DC29]